MRTITSLRLECLRMALTLAASKVVGPDEVIVRAGHFYRFVMDEDQEKADPRPLVEKYGR